MFLLVGSASATNISICGLYNVSLIKSILDFMCALQKVPACRFSSRRRLSHAYPPKDGPQGEVIGHFECPGQDEGPSNDEQGTL